MLVWLLVLATVVLALLCLFFIWTYSYTNTWKGLVRLLFIISFTAFIYLYGCWVFLSVLLKYVFIALATILTVRSFIKKKKPALKKRLSVCYPICSILFTILVITYFTGTTGVPQTVELSFPLRHGQYFVFQGGKGLPTNLFHYGYRGTIYAMDIVKLDNAGRRASQVFSTALSDYLIFGDTIYSPCNGTIVKVQRENPDNIPPSRKRGPSNTNQVIINAGAYQVFLAHLQQNRVWVHPGDSVVTGQPLGRVGNSGFSLEPHLHIQVHRNTLGVPWYLSDPLYIKFDGKSYLLFESIDAK